MKCENCHWWKVTIPPGIGECQNKQSLINKKTTTATDGCNFFTQKLDMPEELKNIFGGFKK